MGHNKKRNTISSKKYYGVIITIAALMVFTVAFFTVVPCIAANTTYESIKYGISRKPKPQALAMSLHRLMEINILLLAAKGLKQ